MVRYSVGTKSAVVCQSGRRGKRGNAAVYMHDREGKERVGCTCDLTERPNPNSETVSSQSRSLLPSTFQDDTRWRGWANTSGTIGGEPSCPRYTRLYAMRPHTQAVRAGTSWARYC